MCVLSCIWMTASSRLIWFPVWPLPGTAMGVLCDLPLGCLALLGRKNICVPGNAKLNNFVYTYLFFTAIATRTYFFTRYPPPSRPSSLYPRTRCCCHVLIFCGGRLVLLSSGFGATKHLMTIASHTSCSDTHLLSGGAWKRLLFTARLPRCRLAGRGVPSEVLPYLPIL